VPQKLLVGMGTPGHGEKPPRKKDDLGGNNCQIMVPPD